jgi:hypothetical protein
MLFLFNVLMLQTTSGQNINDSTFRWFFKNVSDYYGNVSLNTAYSKSDTSDLRKMYPSELENELAVIKIYKMRFANLDIDKLDRGFFRIKTKEDFYKERHLEVNLSVEDSLVLAKEDKLHANISRNILNKSVYDSLNRVQNLLLTSTFDQIFRNRAAKTEPKHMTVLSIFETENMYLIIYQFMMLQGYPHYYIKSDLILR